MFEKIINSIKRLLVGGAVRDHLLGRKIKDHDYLVVGETVDSMRSLGFERVGKTVSAPVFIHPEDPRGDEYALPRREVSTGDGYNDFLYDTANVSIEEDLGRRDFTINAMAMAEDGSIIDPYGGQRDLSLGIIRHINAEAFREDPVRIFRAARFAARYGMRIDESTIELCRSMVADGMINAIPSERVYAEFKKAFSDESPSAFIRHLSTLGALKEVAPEIESMRGVPQPEQHHQEGDVFEHSMMVLDEARRLTADHRILMAAMLHDIGKVETDASELPKHHGHDKRGANLAMAVMNRLGVEKRTRQFVLVAIETHMKFHRLAEMSAGKIVKLCDKLNAKNRDDFAEVFITVGKADALGRIPADDDCDARANFFAECIAAFREIRYISDGKKRRPEAIRSIITERRVSAIKEVIKKYSW